MGLLDGNAGPAPSKIPRYIGIGGAAILILSATLFFLLRFRAEKATASHFLSQVVAGDFQSAYRTWKPSSSYSFQDFLADWGPTGEFGPVKSFEIRSAARPPNASGVVVTVEVSPYAPFPGSREQKNPKNKIIRLWIESSDQSMSYAPEQLTVPR